ncbi:hypothetical protein [Methylobacterium sp.]|uniref:hypothetical protein n=1 Tax=Methylobacterium sp. TaxID=409 RepID=UPI0025E93B65|nr:hypothetical protein [Methylobacterium sp.]MBY0260463.1 hypothetical protein [Methylobacterium sp.]
MRSTLLVAIDAGTAPGWLRDVPAVAVLRRVWLQNFHLAEGDVGGLRGGDRVW